MSDFQRAIISVLQHEGGLVNHTHDPGGITHFGISLRYLQQQDPTLTAEDVKNLTQEAAIKIYQTDWWERYQYSAIQPQEIATKLFDLAINMGSQHAHICLQRALRAATGKLFLEDGLLGEKSFTAINTAPPAIVLAALKSEAAGFYRSLNKPEFETGWLNRAYD
jgi:lysozyme family protein